MVDTQIDTLLEMYDAHEPIVNVAGAWYLQPRSIVFFYYEMEDPSAERKQLAQMFNRIGLRCNVRLEKLDRLDIQDMLQWVQDHQTSLGQFAIELTGGDDEMLFMAGCCYERFPCPLYTHKLDGRYIELPFGREVKPGKGAFTVEQRLLLNDAVLERYGRLTPAELKQPLISLAHRILALQKKHPRQWTNHTKCFQQCVARVSDDTLTVVLDYDTCNENSVTMGKGKLIPQLVRIGALKEAYQCADGIVVVFPDELTRDCLCDYGVWLEIVIYDALRSCGAYDDVQMSCVVRWENEKLVNELDVTATAGMGMLFVSCKTCAPDIKAVAELTVLGERFGAAHTATVLVSMPKPGERLDNIRARCDEMDVRLVDLRQHDRESLVKLFTQMGVWLRAGKFR